MRRRRSLVSLSKLFSAARVLAASMQRWSLRDRWIAGSVGTTVCFLFSLDRMAFYFSPFIVADADHYLDLARGNFSGVIQPFASRPLGALVVAGIARVLHCSVERGFVIEGIAALIVMAAAVYTLLMRTKAPRWMVLAVGLVPFWGISLQDLVLPDLWYSALLSIMLLLLASEQLMPAALMMFPLMLSRESTSLTLVCFLIAGWGALRWRDRIAAVASAVAGALVVGRLAARSQSNVEHLPQAVYMLAKVPWNFMHNVLGLVPWSNVAPSLCSVPAWSMSLHIGPVRAIGVCGFTTVSWEFLARALLTNFGLLPLLLVFLWRRRDKMAKRSVLLKFALLYGGLSLALAPVLGVWFDHLIGYAWPLFLVAAPGLFNEVDDVATTGRRALASVAFVCVQLAAVYWSYRWLWWPQIILEAVFWVIGYILLRIWFGDSRGLIEKPQVAN
jgi:hypothetical protein